MKEKSTVIIYYTKHTESNLERYRDLICGDAPTLKDVAENYAVVFHGMIDNEISHVTPDEIFAIYNGAYGEHPLSGETSQERLRELGTHTSMSVGDMVQIDDTVYVCQSVGWLECKWEIMGASTEKFHNPSTRMDQVIRIVGVMLQHYHNIGTVKTELIEEKLDEILSVHSFDDLRESKPYLLGELVKLHI